MIIVIRSLFRRVAFVWLSKRVPIISITLISGCRPASGCISGRASFLCRPLCDCFRSSFHRSRKSASTSEQAFLFINNKHRSSISECYPPTLRIMLENSRINNKTLIIISIFMFSFIDLNRGLTDESEILKFLQHGTLVGLLPVPHPILIRRYQANAGTTAWFRTYMWGVIYLRNVEPPIWYDTDVKLFEIQRV